MTSTLSQERTSPCRTGLRLRRQHTKGPERHQEEIQGEQRWIHLLQEDHEGNNPHPTPKAPLPTSNRYQDLPPATDPTPKQPPAESKPAPIHAYTPDYKKLIKDLSQTIKNSIQYKFLTDHLLIKTANILDYQKVLIVLLILFPPK